MVEVQSLCPTSVTRTPGTGPSQFTPHPGVFIQDTALPILRQGIPSHEKGSGRCPNMTSMSSQTVLLLFSSPKNRSAPVLFKIRWKMLDLKARRPSERGLQDTDVLNDKMSQTQSSRGTRRGFRDLVGVSCRRPYSGDPRRGTSSRRDTYLPVGRIGDSWGLSRREKDGETDGSMELRVGTDGDGS